MSFSAPYNPHWIPKRNFNAADWTAYQTYLENVFSNFDVSIDPQVAYNNFISHINEAADRHIPKNKIKFNPSTKFSPKPYWSPVLSQAVARRRLALTKFRKNPTPSNFKILKDHIREAQKLIRRARADSWRKFCNSVDETTSSGDLWRKMRWFKGNRVHNSYIDENSCEHLLRSLCPASVPPQEPEFYSENLPLEYPITLHELETCIKSKDTSPGSDNISFSMIKRLRKNSKNVLLALFNTFLSTGFVPNQWRDILIVPIPKPGRDTSLISSLRPISLISCICKIFHLIINRRLEWYFENKGFFSSEMVGFRKSKSCVDGLVRLVTRIQSGFSQDMITLACFIDIDNAYNNINIKALLETLDKAGVGKKICQYLWNFLSFRNINIRQEQRLICRSTSQGLAQGDPLSPLLFNIATCHICKTISNVFISQYADDFVLYTINESTDQARCSLQGSLNILASLLENLGLSISSSKSKVCIFRKGVNRDNISLSVNNISLQNVAHVRYLGMWLDCSLRWTKHIKELRETSLKSLNMLKILAGSGWGVHPKHLRKLYISTIRSRLDFGSFLYSSSCNSNIIKLDRLQNQALRTIGGFIKSTPIHVMESELCLPPLNIRRLYLAGKFWMRVKSLSNNVTTNEVAKLNSLTSSRYWRRRRTPILVQMYLQFNNIKILTRDYLDMYTLDYWMNWYDTRNAIKYSIEGVNQAKRDYSPANIRNTCNEYIENQFSTYYKIFTDGSKDSQGASGAAFFDPQAKAFSKFKIYNDMSIMHIELIAILEALSYIKSIDSKYCVIFTDSKSSLQHVARCTSCLRGIPIAYDIIRTLFELKAQAREVILQWIPSHVGLYGNEEADRLAKEASSDGIAIHNPPFFTDCIHLVQSYCYRLWKLYFDERSVDKGIWYRTFQNEPWRRPWFDNVRLNRNITTIAFRLRSGHIPLNKFAFLMKKVSSPLCEECGVVEDAYHIMVECVRNEDFRAQNLSDIVALRNIGECNIILSHPLSDVAKLVYRLVEIGMRRRVQ